MRKLKILYLRPFWDTARTSEQLKKIYKITKEFGELIAIRNGPEETFFELNTEKEEIKSIFYRFKNKDDSRIDITLIEASDDTWHHHAIDLINSVDVVIVHLAPRDTSNEYIFSPIWSEEPYDNLDSTFDKLVNSPVIEVGTGQGLLRELSFCIQANALKKVIILLPQSFAPRLYEAIKYLKMTNLSENIVDSPMTIIRRTDSGFQIPIKRISALDYNLLAIEKAYSVVKYKKFGDRGFNMSFTGALYHYYKHTKNQKIDPKEIKMGIPSEPVRLPPDQEVKNIRFTPLEYLANIPRGQVVELSLDEIRQIRPNISEQALQCPICHKSGQYIFWYQKRLEPDLSINAPIFFKCQWCNWSDWIPISQ